MTFDFTTTAGITTAAIVTANLVIMFAGGAWEPKQKAMIGAGIGIVWYFVGFAMFPKGDLFSTPQVAFQALFEIIVTIFAAAGVAVYKDAFTGGTPPPVQPPAVTGLAGASYNLKDIERAAAAGETVVVPEPKRKARWVPWNIRTE